MDVEFDDPDLDRLETDPQYSAGFSQAVVQAFRRRMQQIHAAKDERDLRASRSLNFEKLKGSRRGQYSIRLNSQWRLVFELKGSHPFKVVRIIEIVDYH